MSITLKQVEHVAELSRLNLNDEEKTAFTEQLNSILQYVDKLNDLNTDDVEPTTHVLPMTNVMREDVVRPSLPRETLMSNAPEEEEGQFKVPAILE